MSVKTIEVKVIKCDGPGCNAHILFDILNLEASQYQGWTINHIDNIDLCPRCSVKEKGEKS